MGIKITRGPEHEHSPFISFSGDVPRSNPYYLISNITAQESESFSGSVDIVDSHQGGLIGTTVYVILDIPFADWTGVNDETFASATEVIDYVNDLKASAITALDRIHGSLYGELTTVDVGVDSSFSYTYDIEEAFSYYWVEEDFPNGVTVSAYDNRIVSGIVTETGTVDIACKVRNMAGIQTTTLRLNVT